MNRTEAGKLLAVIQARYPHANLGDPDAAATAWALSLGDVPYAAAVAALGPWFKAERFAPDPSEIRGAVAEGLGLAPDEAEAWALVERYRRGYYPGVYSPGWSLPAPVAAALAAIGGVDALFRSEEPAKDRAAFGRAYQTYRKRAVAETDIAAAVAGRDAALPDGAPALPKGGA